MKILYVEDHALFAATTTRQFLAQHSVTIVPSLSAAREALARSGFDLLLVDYDLDDGKGDQLVKEVQDLHDPPIVIGVSSHDDGNAALLKAGAVSTCNKVHFDRIQIIIESVTAASNSKPAAHSLLWWIIPDVLAGMPMPFIHLNRRLNLGGPLKVFDDELPVLYSAGIRARRFSTEYPFGCSSLSVRRLRFSVFACARRRSSKNFSGN
jgi:CheY-like chemotaxis protein